MKTIIGKSKVHYDNFQNSLDIYEKEIAGEKFIVEVFL